MKKSNKFSRAVSAAALSALTIAPSATSVFAQDYTAESGHVTVKDDYANSQKTDGKVIVNGARSNQSIKS